MEVASYDRWRDTVALLKLIAQSEADFEAGRTVSQDEAFARAERAIAEVEQAESRRVPTDSIRRRMAAVA